MAYHGAPGGACHALHGATSLDEAAGLLPIPAADGSPVGVAHCMAPGSPLASLGQGAQSRTLRLPSAPLVGGCCIFPGLPAAEERSSRVRVRHHIWGRPPAPAAETTQAGKNTTCTDPTALKDLFLHLEAGNTTKGPVRKRFSGIMRAPHKEEDAAEKVRCKRIGPHQLSSHVSKRVRPSCWCSPQVPQITGCGTVESPLLQHDSLCALWMGMEVHAFQGAVAKQVQSHRNSQERIMSREGAERTDDSSESVGDSGDVEPSAFLGTKCEDGACESICTASPDLFEDMWESDFSYGEVEADLRNIHFSQAVICALESLGDSPILS